MLVGTWSCGKQKAYSTRKTTILLLEIRLLAVKAGVKNSCEDMHSLSDHNYSDPSYIIDRMVPYVVHVRRTQKQ